jgi:hypothetical protein
MKKNYKNILGALFFAAIVVQAQAQTVLYNQNFNSGAGTFVLNSTDQSSTSSGFNTWIVNNSYTGGSVTINCMGFPFTGTVNNTPAQPAGITSPGGSYLHILSTDAQSAGVTNANYRPAEGLCTFAENYFSKTPAISTTGYTGVSLSFWWLCMGSVNAYGELFYSTNGGSTWTQITPPAQFVNQSTWLQSTFTNPAFDNQASLQFGFRFVNTVATAGADPSFSIDDINVSGTPATGVTEIANTASFSIFPNPATDLITLNLNGFEQNNELLTITITNELGQVVFNQKEAYTNQINLSTDALSKGVYSISISNGKQQNVSKFVKM